jgi:outer membrane protein assembly factor BamB
MTSKPFRHSGKSRTAARAVAGLMLILSLQACSSSDDMQDAIAAINPFGDAKKKLPGDRIPVLEASTPVKVAKGKSVAIAGSKSVNVWGQAAGPVANNPGNASLAGTAGDRVWSATAVSAGPSDFGRQAVRVSARPVAADGRVFSYGPTGDVSANAADGGGQIWKVNLKPSDVDSSVVTPGGGVAVAGGVVYVNTGYGVIAALDAGSGQIVWSQAKEHPGRGAPTVADGKVFAVGEGNVLVCLNAADGKEIWKFNGVPEAGGVIGATNPAVSGGVVVVPFSSGELVAIDIKTGNALWTEQMARASNNFAVTGLSDITGSPVIEDGVVYASGITNRTAALNLKTGAKVWDQPIGSAHTPVVSGNAVFVVDLDDNLYAIDRKAGDVIWSSKLPVVRTKNRATHWAGPVLGGSLLWLVSNDGGIVAVDPKSGQVVVNKEGTDPMMSAPIVADGRLVTLSASGKLSAYD